MADETVKIKDSKTGKIFSATKTKSGYTRGGRTVRLNSTQKNILLELQWNQRKNLLQLKK